MQQENAKKSKKLGWLIAGLAVLLVIVGAVLAIILMPGEQAAPEPTGPVGGRPELYWNIDRKAFIGDDNTAGLSKREAGEDGLYHMRFAINGEQVEYTIADKRLVNVIDNYDVVGLVFDENGNVIDGIDPTTIATEKAKGFFVMRAQGQRLDMNSSFLMNGMSSALMLSDLTEIYNVSESAEKVGAVDTLEVMDKVLIYSNDKDEVTHVFITERQPKADVYWRADRKYDSTAAATSRVPDENGVYTIPFAFKGKQVELKCKDKDLVSAIDKVMVYACPFGLLFDEEGYIVDTIDPGIALRGKLLCQSFNITAMDGDNITATYLMSGAQNGEEVTFTVNEDTEIYNCCIGGSNDYIGEPTKLQMMDRIMAYTDMDGNPLLIYVMYRMVDSPIYYNIERKYSDVKLETTRVPENGYYVFKMAVNGKQVTLKTKDKAIASRVDSFAYKMLGLKVNGNIIERVYTPYVVCGSDAISPATERFVVSQTGTILSFATQGGKYDATTNRVVNSNADICDVSGYPGTKIGEKTTLREGDKIRVLQDIYGNLTHIYVTERYTGYPIYFNTVRYYSAAAGSTRTPDADGYYVYQMVSKGKQVTVKTKNKELADYIDMQNPAIVALKVDKNGIVKDAAPAQSSVMFGRRVAANGLFTKIENGAMNFTLASTGKTYTTDIADDYVAYNCGQVYEKFRGEKTKLQEGDQMVAIRDDKLGKVVEVFVTLRKVDCELYYNCKVMYNSVTKETTRTPDADGNYVFDMAVNGKVKTFKTKDKEIASFIDSKGSVPIAMTVKGSTIKQAYPVTAKKGLKAWAVSNYDFMDAGDGKCVLKCNQPGNANYGKTLEAKLSPKYKAYNVSSYAENFGEQVRLKVGDRVICYYNDAGELEWFYIWYRAAREKGVWSTCSHCNEKVYWQPYTPTTYTEDAHVYLTHDRAATQTVIGKQGLELEKQPNVVLDLNGHKLSTSVTADRLFVVYGDFSVMDTVGGGKIEARNRNTTASCGAIMVQNPGTFRLYSGTLTGSSAETNIANGGIVFVGAGSTFKMYGGTITGGKAKNGGNVHCGYGAFEMYGGKITGGVAEVGGNVYLGSGSFLMGAGTIDGDVVTTDGTAKVTVVGKSTIGKGKVTGLQLVSGIKLPLTKVTADTKVAIEATGVFTGKVTDPSAYLRSFTACDDTFPVFVADGALACGRLAECQACGKEVYWSRFSKGACTGEAHLVLTGDTQMSGTGFVGKTTDNVVVDLNGYTLSTDGERAFSIEGATLNIQDSVGGGKITGRANDSEKAAGTIMAYSGGTLNLYSGEICGGTTQAKIANGGVLFIGENSKFNMYGGTVTGTEATLGGAIYAGKSTVVTIHDGTITGGTATNGGNIYSEGTVILHKGTVSGGQATLGGNIYSKSAVRNNGATVAGGTAANGGNIYMAAGAVNLQGGTVENGVATPVVDGTTITEGKGGNIYAETATVTIGATSGDVTTTVTGGKAYIGGNIYSNKVADAANKAVTVNVKGVVTLGEAVAVEGDTSNNKNMAGNIYCANTLTISGAVTDGKAFDGGNLFTMNWVDIHGTVSGGQATSRGGNIFGNASTVQLHAGAKVQNGKAAKGGNILSAGNVIVKANAEISGGEATVQGGNVMMAAGNKTLTVSGKVLNGVAPVAGNISTVNNLALVVDGGEVTGGSFQLGDGTFTVSGAAKIDGLTLAAGKKLTLGELTDGASITLDASGVFTETNEKAADYAKYFHPVTGAPDVKAHVEENALFFGIKHRCEKCDAEVMWTPFSAAACTGTAHLILTDNVELEKAGFVSKTSDITLDLNGHVLSTKGDRTFGVEGGTLTIQDSAGGGKLVGRSIDKEAAAGAIMAYSGGTLNLYSGEICGSTAETKITNGGVLFIGANSKFNMYGGTVTGTKATLGGAIYAGTGTVVTIHDGTITGGTATNGGNIYSEGTVILHKGTVSGGQATLGGNIYTKSAVRTNGGVVTGGQAANGGNIYVEAGAANIAGGTVENGVATPVVVEGVNTEGMGGNIYAKVGRIIVGAATGDVTATVSGGQAYLGGNIYSAAVASNFAGQAVTVNAKGVVTGGKATNGGNIYIATDTVTVLGTVSNGVATPVVNGTTITDGKGGNIYAETAAVTVGAATGDVIATVTGGKAYIGGNIYSNKVADAANKAVTVNVKGVVTLGEAVAVEGDTSNNKHYAGNIYCANTLSISGAVTDGKAFDGGNLYTKNWTDISGTVSGGQATSRGGNIFASASTVQLHAGAKVQNGKAAKGGNILSAGNVTVKANAEISGGEASIQGGNIMMAAGDKTLTIAGKVLNGVAPVAGNISTVDKLTLTVDSGEVTGGSFKLGNGTFTVSGAAKIDNLTLASGQKLTLGNLKTGADITVSASGVFTNANDNVETYKAYFKPADKITVVGETLSMG